MTGDREAERGREKLKEEGKETEGRRESVTPGDPREGEGERTETAAQNTQ